MKLITGGKDVSELVEQITWSGDTKQVSRTIKFTIVNDKIDKDFTSITINEGDEVVMQDDTGQTIFGGIIFDIDKAATSKKESYLAYDLMFYVNKSDISKMFSGTPERITQELCLDLGIEPGELAPTGIAISMPCFGKKAYDAIMMAYTAAARKNGSKYIPLMTDVNKLSVVEKGELCGVILTGDYNLVEASYKSTLQNLVNRVLIVDKNNNTIKQIDDIESINKYGLVQAVIKQDDGADADTEASKMLTAVSASATVSGIPGEYAARAGYSIIIQEPSTGLIGRFYIESDSHTFSAGKWQMDLNLAFENLMDDKEIENGE